MKENIFQKTFNLKQIDYNNSLYQYLSEDDIRKKAVIIITNQQSSIISANDKAEHFELKGMLLDKIINLDNTNNMFLNEIITIFIGPNDFLICLPDNGKISKKQFLELEEMIYYVESCNQRNNRIHEIKVDYNSNMNIKYDYLKNDIKELLSQLSNYINEPKYFYNENIIGRDLLTNYERASMMVEQLANYEDNENNYDRFIKGYSSIFLLSLFSLLSSIIFLIMGVFIIMN